MSEALSGKDVQRYREAWDCIRVAGPNEPEAVFDEAWVKGTVQSNAAETHRLEAELRGYKNNLIKESIRVSTDSLELVTIDGLSYARRRAFYNPVGSHIGGRR